MRQGPIVESDLPPSQDGAGRTIVVGSRVRSFDFPTTTRDLEGDRACFVEGIVEGVERHSFDCPRYVLRATRRVFTGKEKPVPDELFFPPLNGTPMAWAGRVTDGVEVIET